MSPEEKETFTNPGRSSTALLAKTKTCWRKVCLRNKIKHTDHLSQTCNPWGKLGTITINIQDRKKNEWMFTQSDSEASRRVWRTGLHFRVWLFLPLRANRRLPATPSALPQREPRDTQFNEPPPSASIHQGFCSWCHPRKKRHFWGGRGG